MGLAQKDNLNSIKYWQRPLSRKSYNAWNVLFKGLSFKFVQKTLRVVFEGEEEHVAFKFSSHFPSTSPCATEIVVMS